jgi:riboflavin kinase / FMN adenylyltransferase
MKIVRDWRRAALGPCAVAIGVFDGVHLGHRAILGAAADQARKRRLLFTALTMYPHPSEILRPQSRVPLLQSLDRRLELLKGIGVEVAVVLRFDRALAGMGAEDFVHQVLIRKLNARSVAIGANFRFGRGAEGDADFLSDLGRRLGIAVSTVRPVRCGAAPISSSRIRAAVAAGRFEEASRLLGRPYALLGAVVRGDGRGRELGYPTLNLQLEHELVPPAGVYAVLARSAGRAYPGVLHLGPRPTFDAPEFRAECHLLQDLRTDGYGQRFAVQPVRKIRGVRRFAHPEALSRQITRDIRSARAALQRPVQRVY